MRRAQWQEVHGGGAAFTAVVAAKLASVRRALNRRPGLGKGQAHVRPPESKGLLIVALGNVSRRH